MAVIGSLIKGKYEILKLLGKGGMSRVYLALDCHLNKQWAVKEVIKEDSVEGRAFLKAALKEADVIKGLDHPGIPRVVDIIDYEDVVYIVMDYVEGESLGKLLRESGPLNQEMAITIAEDICNIFSYLHSLKYPIIYRDLKPDNIMLTPAGSVKLVDFGNVLILDGNNTIESGKLGTKGYAAPEQFAAESNEDERTDIYSFGATLYSLLTGSNPGEYEAIKPIRYINSELSAGLERIIIRCMSEKPEDRYQSFDEVTYALWHYEEADEKYLSRLKMRMGLFLGTLILSVFSLLFGIVFYNKYIDKRDNNYESHLIKASEEVSFDETIDEYRSAIALLPGDKRAYIQMIGYMKSDAAFDVNEEAILRQLINENIDALKADNTFGYVCFETGHLYWFYYDYGSENNDSDALLRMKAALPWMKNAYANLDPVSEPDIMRLCAIYIDIAEFNTGINLMVEEAADVGVYAEYYVSLNNLYCVIGPDDSELLNLEVCETILDSISLYKRKFINDGITAEEIEQLYENAINRMVSIVPTTEKTEMIWNRIMTSYGE